MFHRIIFLCLIVSSLSCNFNRLSVPFVFIVHEHRLQEYSKMSRVSNALYRASDISRKKKQNFAGFSGANFAEKSAEFAGFSREEKSKVAEKSADFAGF